MAAHLAWSVDTMGGRVGLLDKTLSISSINAFVNLGSSCNYEEFYSIILSCSSIHASIFCKKLPFFPNIEHEIEILRTLCSPKI